MSSFSDALHIKLSKIVGADRVRTDKMERLLHNHDLAPLPPMMELGFKMMPDAVVRPQTTKEVSDIVKLAVKEHIPIVPRGGASWGFGGAMPCEGGIVLDMTTMNNIVRMDTDNLEVEVEAGATWQKVSEEAAKAGMFIGYYPSSAPAATLAGWISTGGIGIGSYKYGTVKDNVRNMQIVLPEGQILDTGFNYVSDHSSGYNLTGLLMGMEGTLGIVTSVTLKAVPAPDVIKPISVMFPTLMDLFPLMHAITRKRITPLHIAFVDEFHLQYLKDMGRHVPGDGAVLNIVLEGAKESVAWEETVIDELIAEHGGTRLSDEDATHEWEENPYEFRVREVGVSAALSEVVIPITEFSEMIPELYKLIKGMKMEASIIGMLGDRNTVLLMPYYLYVEKKLVRSMTSLSFPKKVGDLAMRHKGRPLGFGLFFAQNLKKIRGNGAGVMFDIKTVLDPHDVVNPGKMFEGMTRYGMPMPGFAMNMGMNLMAGGKKVLTKDKAFKKAAKDHPKEPHGEGPG
jgi:glycolate oxidase